MIRLKTAVLLAASLSIGAIIGNADQKDVNAFYHFGLNMGIAFQLQDDYLDVFAKADKFGKKIGGDILANKKTFLLISALNSDNDLYRTELLTWLQKKDFVAEDKITAITEIYNALRIGELTRELAQKYFQEALGYLNSVKIRQERKSALYQLLNNLMKRDH
jgi:geranylgeranyl diphosphate synthase type II